MYSIEHIKKSVVAIALSTLIEVNEVALEDSRDPDDIEYRNFLNEVARNIIEDLRGDIISDIPISKPKWTKTETP